MSVPGNHRRRATLSMFRARKAQTQTMIPRRRLLGHRNRRARILSTVLWVVLSMMHLRCLRHLRHLGSLRGALLDFRLVLHFEQGSLEVLTGG